MGHAQRGTGKGSAVNSGIVLRRIGMILKYARKGRGLTMRQMGEVMGVTAMTISRWEEGKGVLGPYAQYLGVEQDVDFLLQQMMKCPHCNQWINMEELGPVYDLFSGEK